MIYKLNGVCAEEINFEAENGVIKSVSFTKGCNGNLQAISRLLPGMAIPDVVDKLKGIRCGRRDTSCPDQLALILEQYIKE